MLTSHKLTGKSKVEMTQAREKLGLSQKELGKKVGVAQATIHAYESGRQVPRLCYRHKVEEILGINLEVQEFRGEEIESKTFNTQTNKLRLLIDYVSEHGPEKAREHLELAIQILSV